MLPRVSPCAPTGLVAKQRPVLWIALTRPDNLVNALAVAQAGREHFAGCRLLYENSSWWRVLDWREEAAQFHRVDCVEQVAECRGLCDLPRFYRALEKRQRVLAGLKIDSGDTIVTLAGITKLSIALASAYPEMNILLCTTVQKYVDASQPVSWTRYRPTTSGFLQRWIVEPRLGLRRTVRLKPWRGGGDGVRRERPEERLEDIFKTILLLSNDGTGRPRTAGPNVLAARFPSLHDLDNLPSGENESGRCPGTVLFFGTPFLLVRNLSPAVYRERLNACLSAIRRWYGTDCRLVYRPHPAETREVEQLDLGGFVIEADRHVAELYFLRNSHQIRAVYSVSSTVSRVALNYGLNGYALWRCFPFDRAAARYFVRLMGRVPSQFEVHSLEHPPAEYAAWADRSKTFHKVINGLFSRIDTPVETPAARGTEGFGAEVARRSRSAR